MQLSDAAQGWGVGVGEVAERGEEKRQKIENIYHCLYYLTVNFYFILQNFIMQQKKFINRNKK